MYYEKEYELHLYFYDDIYFVTSTFNVSEWEKAVNDTLIKLRKEKID